MAWPTKELTCLRNLHHFMEKRGNATRFRMPGTLMVGERERLNEPRVFAMERRRIGSIARTRSRVKAACAAPAKVGRHGFRRSPSGGWVLARCADNLSANDRPHSVTLDLAALLSRLIACY